MSSVNTATAKRVSRTLRASPSKGTSSSNVQTTREDIENLSAVMLASLGITPKSTSSSTSTTSNNASTNSGTPQNSERTIKRTLKGSTGPSSDNGFATPASGHTAGVGSKSRTVSSSSTLSTGAGTTGTSRSRDRTSSAEMLSPHQQAPLTAIRRPAQPSTSSSNRTVSTPLSAKASTNPTISKSSASPGRVVASTVHNGTTGLRSKRGSSALPTRDSGLSMSTSTSVDARDRKSSNTNNRVSDIMSQTPLHLAQDADADEDQRPEETGVYVSQEEYASLVALLSAKDEQINALTAQVEEAKKENTNLKTRNAQVQKEKDTLVAERKTVAAGKVQSGNGQKEDSAGNGTGEVSRAEMDAFKKQYEMQENLLEGFQRENEKATLEIDALKKKEKHLAEHLKKIYGPAFSAEHDLVPLTPDSQISAIGSGKRFPGNNTYNTSITGPGSPLGGGVSGLSNPLRRTSGGLQALPFVAGNGYTAGPTRSSPLAQESGSSEILAEMDENHIIPDDATSQAQVHYQLPQIEPAVLMDQLLSVQSLLQRFEKRLLVRESELLKKEKEAEGQLSKLEGMKEQLVV